MDWYQIVKIVHIISATILFGTGLGTAFFMFRSNFAGDIHARYFAAKTTMLADTLFTAPAAIIQPLTGLWLIWQGGYGWMEAWLALTYVLYILVGACWLPVVWIQIQLARLIAHSIETGEALPERHDKLFRIWFLLGWPAFIGLVIVFFLMVLSVCPKSS